MGDRHRHGGYASVGTGRGQGDPKRPVRYVRNTGRETVRILYGGSVSSKNAVELINEPDVDGFLIGGSALKVDELTRICKLTLETTA